VGLLGEEEAKRSRGLRFAAAGIVAAAARRCHVVELQGYPFRCSDLRRVRGIKQGTYGLS